MNGDQFIVTWVDSGREPKCPTDPRYPEGIDLKMAPRDAPRCEVTLPYPAKRCGRYLIRCQLCYLTVIITTAGRADDPRSAEVPCAIMRPTKEKRDD